MEREIVDRKGEIGEICVWVMRSRTIEAGHPMYERTHIGKLLVAPTSLAVALVGDDLGRVSRADGSWAV